MEINAEARLPSASEAGAAPFQHTGTGGDAATHKGSGPCETDATERVSQSRHSLSDADREQAICRASELARYFEAEYRLFWALWTRDGLLDQKAAYDIAMSNYHRATQIRDSLMRGQRPGKPQQA